MIKFIYMAPETWSSVVSEYDVTAPQTGVELLRDLLLPRRSDVRNVLLADLPSSDWFKQITKSIASLPPQISHHARSLVEKLAGEAMISLNLPETERGPTTNWQELGKQALRSDAVDLLLVSSSDGTNEKYVPTSRLKDDKWLAESFETAVNVPRDGAGQTRILRRLLQNNTWCVLQFPYIKGEKGDEMFTVEQIIRLAGGAKLSTLTRLELILNLNLGADRPGLLKRLRPKLGDLKQELKQCRFRVFCSPESFLDRELLFGTGDFTPRWYVTAGHVAIHREGARDTTTWTLRSRKDAREACQRFSRILGDDANLLWTE